MKTSTMAAILAAALPLIVAGCATRTTDTVASAPPPTTVVTVPPAPTTTVPPGTVVASPGTSSVVVASPATNGTTRLTGRVTDVERDGEIKVKTTDGRTMKLKVPAATAASVREGDQATVDVTFTR